MQIKADYYSLSPSRFLAGTKGSYGFEKLELSFSEEWEGLSKKLVFYTPSGVSVCVVYADSPVYIPQEVFAERGCTKYAVIGYDGNRTLISVSGEIDVLSTLEDTDDESIPPTESETAQILSYMNAALSAAETLRSDAENGKFDGRNGSAWFTGDAVTGEGTGISAVVSNSYKGDIYLNTSSCNVYIATDDNVWSYCCNIKGMRGETGATGAAGVAGAKGDTGEKGDKGDKGDRGLAGENGAKGEKGDKGDTGAAAGFGTPMASVTQLSASAEPTVSVSASGDDTAKVFSFAFGIPAASTTRYTVNFNGQAAAGERLDNAAGLTAGVGTDQTEAVNDFDNIYPWSARRRCCGYWNTDGNFVVNAYKGEPGYAEDGTNGEVWVEHSLFYYRHDFSSDESETVSISPVPTDGYSPAPIFQRGGSGQAPRQKAYTPAYPMATVDGVATSRAGVFPGNYSLNSAMNTARTLGQNYTVTTCAEQYTECLYMWVEFATRNLQTLMSGATNMAYSDKHTAKVAENGTNRIIIDSEYAGKFVVGQTIGIGSLLSTPDIANNRIVSAIEDYGDSGISIVFDGDPVDISVGDVVFTLAWINGSCNAVLSSSGSHVSNTGGKYNCVYRGKESPYGNAFEWISDVLIRREGSETTSYT
ncbi:MAG: collagen-like protein, partial [Eubacteriales bacterium]